MIKDGGMPFCLRMERHKTKSKQAERNRPLPQFFKPNLKCTAYNIGCLQWQLTSILGSN